MADPATIRQAIAERLKGSFPDFQATGYVLANPTPPGFEVDVDPEGGVNYDQAMGRGIDEWWWVVRAFVSGAADIGGQQKRDELLRSSGDMSVKAALETDRRLGGVCHHLRVVSALPKSYVNQESGTQYAGAEWRIQMLASG